ncbi:MAG: hypothetical protein K9J30_09085 [Bacteroidales bacterium]|nr:hypothetical protein [Bacteroidales bacterium]
MRNKTEILQEIRHAAFRERYSDMKKAPEDLDVTDLVDYTIIHERPDWFLWLMENGDLVNKQGKFFTKYRSRLNTSLTYAVSHHLVDVSRYLWEKGARVSQNLHDRLLLAIQWNKHEMAELLFEMGARILYKYKFKKYLKMADERMKVIIGRNLDACPPGSEIK